MAIRIRYFFSSPHKNFIFLIILCFVTSIVQIVRLFFIITSPNPLLSLYRNNLYSCTIPWQQYRPGFVDRNNTPLAETRIMYSACVIPHQLLPSPLLSYLDTSYPMAYKKIKENPTASFCFIARHISDDDYHALIEKKFEEIFFINEQARVYHFPFIAPVLGNVDIDMKGIGGLEYTLNKKMEQKRERQVCTRLTPGEKFIGESTPPLPPIQTSLDVALSYETYAILKNTVEKYQSSSATAVIMEGTTGEILSLCQFPLSSFQGDEFEKPIATTNAYEMGSIIKAFCMLAALEEKVVTIDEIIDCRATRETMIRGFHISTWKAQGKVPFCQVIQESNNIGMTLVALRLNEKLFSHYQRMCFGKKTGIELPGETAGYITPLEKWSRQSIISLSYGYEIATTLLQLVRAWSLFLNEGRMVTPTLLKKEHHEQSSKKYSDEAIEVARTILTYDHEHWAIKKRNHTFHGITILGKTGTANILENGTYKKEKNTYTFVGSLEKGEKKIIIGVYIRESNIKNAYAATIALPCFLDLAEKVVMRYFI